MPPLRFLLRAAAAAAITACATALHKDEAGLFDWHAPGIGVPTRAVFGRQSKERKEIFVITASNAVASLRVKTGEVRWRRVLGTKDSLACVAVTGSNVVVGTQAGEVLFFDSAHGTPMRVGAVSVAPREILDCAASESGDDVRFVTADVAVPTDSGAAATKNIAVVTMAGAKLRPPVPIDADSVAAQGGLLHARLSPAGKIVLASADGVVAGDATTGKTSGRAALPGAIAGILTPMCGSGLVVRTANGSTVDVSLGEAAPVATEATGGAVRCNSEVRDVSVAVSATGAVVVNEVQTKVRDRVGAVPPSLLAVRSTEKRSDAVFVTHDGHLHFIAVTGDAVTTAWSALVGVAEPAHVVFASHPVFEEGAHERETQFGMRQVFVVVSRRGGLYGYSTKGKGKLEWASSAVLQAEELYPDVKGKPCTVDAAFADGHNTVVRLRFGDTLLQLAYDAATGQFLSGRGHHSEAILSLPDGTTVLNNMQTDAVAKADRHFYTVNSSAGAVTGFTIPGNTTQAREEWNLNHNAPLVMVVDGSNHFAIASVESVHMVPGGKDGAKEVRSKFSLANIVVTAHYSTVADDDADELDSSVGALVLTAVNTATGSVIATMAHVGASGPVRGVFVEHAMVYHFFDARSGHHRVGVWELYAHQDAPMLDSQTTSPANIIMSFLNTRRTFDARRVRAPTVNSRILAFAHGAIDAVGVTATAQGIARKQVIFATTKGIAYAVPFTTLLDGGIPAEMKVRPGTVVALPTNAITHSNRVLRSELMASSPTPLESSTHVVIAGLDLFYARVSSGKPFDLLNEGFNKAALIAVCAILPIAALALRVMANRKTLKLAWA